MAPRVASLFLLLTLLACGGGGTPATSQPNPPGSPAPIGPADVALLFYGNSHTHLNGLPLLVGGLFEQARPNQKVHLQVAADYLFLDERLNDAPSQALLGAAGWTHVLLQAQKVSSSGTVLYSTAESQEWVRRVKARGALPVLFPEWPRRGVDEGARTYAVYESIALAEPACVAPVPQAFERAALALPQLALHAPDGNHSSPAGALLAAFILYASASGDSLQEVRPLIASPLEPAVQRQLRDVAVASLSAGPAARHRCP